MVSTVAVDALDPDYLLTEWHYLLKTLNLVKVKE